MPPRKSSDNLLLEPNGYYLSIKDWHRKACPDNDCAAALLAFLLFFHKHKQSMKEYARITNELLRKKGKAPVADETDWQFHTDEILERKLFFWKNDSIRKARLYLYERGFIEIDPPAFLQSIYKSGRTKWFMIKIGAIQDWIMENYPLLEIQESEITALAPVERNYRRRADMYGPIARRIFTFRQRFFKEAEIVPEKAQLSKITARLKGGLSELDLVYAVIGNSESAWHKGENPNGIGDQKMTYHLIRHIFKENDQVINFRMIAESAGWNREKVFKIYEDLMGLPLEGKSELEQIEQNLSPEEKIQKARIYQEVGSLIAELVVGQKMKLNDVIKEFCNRADEMKITIFDIADHERLGREIIDAISQQEIVPAERRQKIIDFAKRFIEKLKGAE